MSNTKNLGVGLGIVEESVERLLGEAGVPADYLKIAGSIGSLVGLAVLWLIMRWKAEDEESAAELPKSTYVAVPTQDV